MINHLRKKVFDWLQRKLDERMDAMELRLQKEVPKWIETAKKNQMGLRDRALIAPTANFSPEARIDNKVNKQEAIVLGANSFLRGHLLTYGHGGMIKIGDWCFIGDRTEIWSMSSITIGDRVLISHDVNIHDGSAHSLDSQQRHEHFKSIVTKGHPRNSQELPGVVSSPIVIEDDVWISFGVTILRGVTIGKGSVIAAGSIVTKDVPAGVIYHCEVKPVIKPLTSLADADTI